MTTENFLLVRKFLTKQITGIQSTLTSDLKNQTSKLTISEREKLSGKLEDLKKSRQDLIIAHDKKKRMQVELQAELTISEISSAVSKNLKKEDIQITSLDDLKYNKPQKKKSILSNNNASINSEII